MLEMVLCCVAISQARSSWARCACRKASRLLRGAETSSLHQSSCVAPTLYLSTKQRRNLPQKAQGILPGGRAQRRPKRSPPHWPPGKELRDCSQAFPGVGSTRPPVELDHTIAAVGRVAWATDNGQAMRRCAARGTPTRWRQRLGGGAGGASPISGPSGRSRVRRTTGHELRTLKCDRQRPSWVPIRPVWPGSSGQHQPNWPAGAQTPEAGGEFRRNTRNSFRVFSMGGVRFGGRWCISSAPFPPPWTSVSPQSTSQR